MAKNKIAIILNVSVENQEIEPLHQQIEEICHGYAMEVTLFHVYPDADIQQITKKAIYEQYAIIAAAGGDGTVSAVARELAGTSVILGILPLGTLNHFARDLQIPIDLREALSVLSTGEVMTFDTASVNDQYFINNSSIGLYPRIVKRRDVFRQKGFHKWIAFLSAFILVVSNNPFLRLRIISAKKNIDCKAPFLFIGNNQYVMQGYGLGSRTSLTSGKLFLSLMHHTNRLNLFRIIVQTILGLTSQDSDFDTWESEEVTVYSKRKFLEVALDGEVIPLQTPLRYLIHPHSLRVIVSRDYAHNRSHF